MGLFSFLGKSRGKAAIVAGKPNRQLNEKIINDYGAAMERYPSSPMRIDDASVLPYPKEVILDVLIYEIGQEYPKHMRKMLCGGAISLAYYQPGVGEEPLERLGVDISKLPLPAPGDADALTALAKILVEADASTHNRFAQFDHLVQADLHRISSKIQVAMR